MIADSTYTWASDGNIITIQFDYSGLKEGREWIDEELNLAPPEYIERINEIDA